MIELLKNIVPSPMSKRKLDKIYNELKNKYPHGSDHWGLNLKQSRLSLKFGYPVYKNYFRTRVINPEKVQDKPYMVVSNHTGQIPIDAMLITCAFLCDIWPPRILRSMVERFAVALPFFGQFVQENGAVLGDRTNCYHLLQQKESVLVFPEGVRGISKSSVDYYRVQNFTRGFFRLALKSRTDILPIAVVGAEEFYPFVYQAKKVAKMFGLPALPITPFFPALGPVGIVPLPSPVDIIIGDAYTLPESLTPDSPDHLIDQHVDAIEKQIQEMIKQGLKNRRSFWGADLLKSALSKNKSGGEKE